MTYGFELIVPSIAETKLTSYIGGVRQQRAKTTLEIKFYAHEPRIRCTIDGRPVAWDLLPTSAQQKALYGLRMLTAAWQPQHPTEKPDGLGEVFTTDEFDQSIRQ